MEELLAEVARRWAAQGVAHGPPATPDDVAVVEARYGVRLPDEVRAYFLRLNGSERGKDGPMDEESIAFWHLSEFRPLSEEAPELRVPGGELYFVFADYLLWSFVYALRLSADAGAPAPVVVVHDGDCVIEAAPSLRAFLERYLARDPDTLFPELPAEWRARYERVLPDLRARCAGSSAPRRSRRASRTAARSSATWRASPAPTRAGTPRRPGARWRWW